MRAVIQRVSEASVSVDGKCVGSIGKGLCVLLGIKLGDGPADLEYIIKKTAEMRIFEDEDGKMNLPLTAVGGEVLLISQFTLYGDARKGRRPDFFGAERPEKAEPLYMAAAERFRSLGIKTETGIFGADMKLSILNDGPVTILLDSEKVF